jgi:hypothetical protein
MSPLDTFLSKLSEYGSNNISALEGRIQFTFNEREDLKMLFAKVDADDRPKAHEAARARGLDTHSWK